MNEKVCLICLDNIEDIEKVVEYNHCGIYYVHNECLNNWNHNECIICRKNFIDIINSETLQENTITININEPVEPVEIDETGESINSGTSVDIIDVMTNPDINRSYKCRIFVCSLLIMVNFLFVGSYILLEMGDNNIDE